MKKRLLFIALLAAVALLLCACGTPTDEVQQPEGEASGQSSPLNNPVDQGGNASPVWGTDYDPSSEEDAGGFNPSAAYDAYGNQVYPGATPILINPIDMPTPTDRPSLTFTYGEYKADKLGIQFKSAVGYEVDDSSATLYVLTEPAAAVKDDYPCVITFETTAVTTSYTTRDISRDLSAYLESLGKGYKNWEVMQASSRKLMGKDGYYNNYRGEMADGSVVRGRVHMVRLSDTKVLTLHITCPGWYNTSYMKIYDSIRESIKAIE